MRKLNERFMHYRMDNADGIKVWLDNGEWIHFALDPDLPYVGLTAEAADDDRARQLTQEFGAEIERMVSAES